MRAWLAVAALLGMTAGAAATDPPSVTTGDLDRIRDALVRCWPNAGPVGSEQVRLVVRLRGDGSVESADVAGPGPPADGWLQEMEARARRAVLRCQPYPMPAGYRATMVLTVMLPLPRR